MRHTAYAVRRQLSCTSVFACRFVVCEEHWLSSFLRGCWLCCCCWRLRRWYVVVVLRRAGFLNRPYVCCFFFLFPFIDLFRSSEPCIVVFQVITLCCLSFTNYHKLLLQVIYPSLGWSSCFSWRSRRHDKSSRIPLSNFPGPSVWALGGDPEGLSPFQFLLCFDPFCDFVCKHFSRASLHVLNPVFQLIFLMCYPHHLL